MILAMRHCDADLQEVLETALYDVPDDQWHKLAQKPRQFRGKLRGTRTPGLVINYGPSRLCPQHALELNAKPV